MSSQGPSMNPRSEASTQPVGAAQVGDVRIFVIFDTEHDSDLYREIDEQSHGVGGGFSVIGASEATGSSAASRARLRRQIRAADQAVIICGEHTGDSPSMRTEIEIAIEERTPYFMLWGRRGVMCTMPAGVSRHEGMYGWTDETLRDQFAHARRRSRTAAEARRLRRVSPER